MFVLSVGCLIAVRFVSELFVLMKSSGVGAKIAWLRRRNGPSQIRSEIPQITARLQTCMVGQRDISWELFVEEKSQWAGELHELIPKPCRDRPFVCRGLPEMCDVVVVGENPG